MTTKHRRTVAPAFTAAERAELYARAQAEGRSMANLVRVAVLDYLDRMRPRPSPEWHDVPKLPRTNR